MTELIINAIQIAALQVGALIALVRAIRQKSKEWTLLALFFGSGMMGDLYWMFCLFFYGRTPQITLVSDLNWFASYLLLYLLLRQAAPPKQAGEKRLLPWLGFVFALGMASLYFSLYVYWSVALGEHYVLWAKALINLSYGMVMGLLLFSVIRRLMDARVYRAQRFLCVAILILCLVEYSLWTSSCFYWSDTLANPYFWFDNLLTVSFLLFLPATRKAVAE